MSRTQFIWVTGLLTACGLTFRQANVVDGWRSEGLSSAEVRQVAAPPVDEKDQGKDAANANEKDSDKESKAPNKRRRNVDKDEVQYNKLTPMEASVILRRGTERPFTGEYTSTKDPGTYICRRCNAPLYRSDDKFESHCGWPSFDDEIKGAVKKRPEIDGTGRIEIVCNNCGGHLGHVFVGERYTAKNTRHCVNSVSMKFIAQGKPLPEVIGKKESKESTETADSKEKTDAVKTEAVKTEETKAGSEK